MVTLAGRDEALQGKRLQETSSVAHPRWLDPLSNHFVRREDKMRTMVLLELQRVLDVCFK